MKSRVLTLVLLAALAAPAAAGAQGSVAPPGNSGVDEYLETIPTAGGATKPPGSHNGHNLSAATRRQLAAQGADGQAAAALAESTAPSRAGHGTGTKIHQLPADEVREPSGSGIPAAIAKAVEGSGSGGMGIWLPILLIASALAIGAAAVARRRSTSA